MSLDSVLQRLWYGPAWRSLPLWPLSAVFWLLTALKQWLYRTGVLKTEHVGAPVVVVGNLTVGGTGKTPMTLWLAQQLQQRGRRVGIITRGYGGHSAIWPQRVHAHSDPHQVGDEAVLLASELSTNDFQTIVCAGPDRVAAARLAISEGAELIVSDDGLQHLRLHRDCELVVVDGQRGLGNGWLLPAGPLRELPARLKRVNAILVNARTQAQATFSARTAEVPLWTWRLALAELRSFNGVSTPLSSLAGQPVHVVTGIGHPESFIAALAQQGMQVQARVLPDHAVLTPQDIHFDDDLPVLMTSKDAVKCRAFAATRQAGNRYFQACSAVEISPNDAAQLLAVIEQCVASASTAAV